MPDRKGLSGQDQGPIPGNPLPQRLCQEKCLFSLWVRVLSGLVPTSH